jgi:hypothetical protein
VKISAKIQAVFFTLFVSVAYGAQLDAIPEKSELVLNNGITDVRVDGLTVRVVRAFVGTLTAHGYETYTGFVLPKKPAGTWLHILVDRPDSDSSDFTTVESADSTVQAIAMYMDDGALFAVQATKSGQTAPDLYLKASRVTFKVYRFNGNQDMARFKQKKVSESKSIYIDAGDALAKEFFVK